MEYLRSISQFAYVSERGIYQALDRVMSQGIQKKELTETIQWTLTKPMITCPANTLRQQSWKPRSTTTSSRPSWQHVTQLLCRSVMQVLKQLYPQAEEFAKAVDCHHCCGPSTLDMRSNMLPRNAIHACWKTTPPRMQMTSMWHGTSTNLQMWGKFRRQATKMFQAMHGYGLIVSFDKTVVILGAAGNKLLARLCDHHTREGQVPQTQSQWTKEHTYLGKFEQATLAHRMQLAAASYNRLESVLRSKVIAPTKRIHLWKACVLSCLQHGLTSTGLHGNGCT